MTLIVVYDSRWGLRNDGTHGNVKRVLDPAPAGYHRPRVPRMDLIISLFIQVVLLSLLCESGYDDLH